MEQNLAAQAIDYDPNSDVGLLRIRPGHVLPATRVVPVSWKPNDKMQMTTVGCSEGHDATAWTTYITDSHHSGEIHGRVYRAIECVHAPRQGRSGGGLFTLTGEVAGVCDFADPMRNRGLYAAPESIYKLLDRNGLAVCYAPSGEPGRTGPGTRLVADRSSPGRTTSPSKYRAQGPDDSKAITMPPADVFGVRLPSLTSKDEEARPDTDKAHRMAWQPSVRSEEPSPPGEAADELKLADNQPRPRTKARLQNVGEPGPRGNGSPNGVDHPAGAEATDLQMAPSPDDDPFAGTSAEDKPIPRPAPIKSETSSGWRPARRPAMVAGAR
jgi:hypothetical protein